MYANCEQRVGDSNCERPLVLKLFFALQVPKMVDALPVFRSLHAYLHVFEACTFRSYYS